MDKTILSGKVVTIAVALGWISIVFGSYIALSLRQIITKLSSLVGT